MVNTVVAVGQNVYYRMHINMRPYMRGETTMEKTWKPTTAGVLSIVAGGLTLFALLALLAFFPATAVSSHMHPYMPAWPIGVANMMILMAFPLALCPTVAIAGGIFALKRRLWGLALAGAICAVFSPAGILGILAVIFVAMGRSEFA
jgi:hypothetical protein